MFSIKKTLSLKRLNTPPPKNNSAQHKMQHMKKHKNMF